MKSTPGVDPRVSWHVDTDFGKVVGCTRPLDRSNSAAIGSWGDCVARNYLVVHGICTVRHAVFRLSNYRLVADLYHPPSGSVYEVKTGRRSNISYFRTKLWRYQMLLSEQLAKRVVYIRVDYARESGFTPAQKNAIEGCGFDAISI